MSLPSDNALTYRKKAFGHNHGEFTSGLIASLISDTEGASSVMKGAFVTYSNEAKIKQGVPAEIIERHSVYSKETACAMAQACRNTYDADFGIGIYVPNEASFLAGVFNREKTYMEDPSLDPSTSYIAAVEWNHFQSFEPSEYEYWISTGTSEEIRSNFERIRK